MHICPHILEPHKCNKWDVCIYAHFLWTGLVNGGFQVLKEGEFEQQNYRQWQQHFYYLFVVSVVSVMSVRPSVRPNPLTWKATWPKHFTWGRSPQTITLLLFFSRLCHRLWRGDKTLSNVLTSKPCLRGSTWCVWNVHDQRRQQDEDGWCFEQHFTQLHMSTDNNNNTTLFPPEERKTGLTHQWTWEENSRVRFRTIQTCKSLIL